MSPQSSLAVDDDQCPYSDGGDGQDDDPVEIEIDVFTLPVEPAFSLPSGLSTTSASQPSVAAPVTATVNRLLFTQSPNWLRDRLVPPSETQDHKDEEDQVLGEGSTSTRPGGRLPVSARDPVQNQTAQARYKPNVNHLQLGFNPLLSAAASLFSNSGGGSSSFFPVLNSQRPSSIHQLANQHHLDTAGNGNSSNSASLEFSCRDVFVGEGFSNPDAVNHAIGFFQNGKLFLLPVHKTFEMRRKLTSKADEAQIQTQRDKQAKQVLQQQQQQTTTSGAAPIRVRFARAESDLQRRRREQSAYYKQKLVEQDPWLDLRMGRARIDQIYAKAIASVEETDRRVDRMESV